MPFVLLRFCAPIHYLPTVSKNQIGLCREKESQFLLWTHFIGAFEKGVGKPTCNWRAFFS